ncbi:acyltransferase family protein [Stakelama pacifica]|uniref:Exopolysaccharide production protein ExoZ n=1 Tax=Stakelama pacifica TaxID=517720 RepID=A0A4R6FJB8_9SPHN|nr:acyltransferase [Stakelama pacifica]TDN80624.1 exopolysaccharide production protein ExoZ [Stakelama pacifica]
MNKIIGLQYLRAIAVLGVVAFHAAGRVGIDLVIGEAGVDIFFVLSGFLMVAITNEKTLPAKFILDRFRRIAPSYWAATVAMVLGALIGMFPRAKIEAGHILASFLFIPAVSPSLGKIYPILVQGWTLNYEIFFYLLFSLVLFIRLERIRVFVLAAMLTSLVLAGLVSQNHGTLVTFYTNPILLEFLAGALLGSVWKTRESFPAWMGFPFCFLAGFLFILVEFLNVEATRILIFGVPSLLLVAGTLVIEKKYGVRRYFIPLLIGDASYSIYLWHTFALSIALKIGQMLRLESVSIVIFATAAGVFAGILAYWWVEKPLHRFVSKRRFTKEIPNFESPEKQGQMS